MDRTGHRSGTYSVNPRTTARQNERPTEGGPPVAVLRITEPGLAMAGGGTRAVHESGLVDHEHHQPDWPR